MHTCVRCAILICAAMHDFSQGLRTSLLGGMLYAWCPQAVVPIAAHLPLPLCGLRQSRASRKCSVCWDLHCHHTVPMTLAPTA